jgi:hypothetical protein
MTDAELREHLYRDHYTHGQPLSGAPRFLLDEIHRTAVKQGSHAEETETATPGD